MMSTNQEHIIEKVGVFTPKPKDVNELNNNTEIDVINNY